MEQGFTVYEKADGGGGVKVLTYRYDFMLQKLVVENEQTGSMNAFGEDDLKSIQEHLDGLSISMTFNKNKVHKKETTLVLQLSSKDDVEAFMTCAAKLTGGEILLLDAENENITKMYAPRLTVKQKKRLKSMKGGPPEGGEGGHARSASRKGSIFKRMGSLMKMSNSDLEKDDGGLVKEKIEGDDYEALFNSSDSESEDDIEDGEVSKNEEGEDSFKYSVRMVNRYGQLERKNLLINTTTGVAQLLPSAKTVKSIGGWSIKLYLRDLTSIKIFEDAPTTVSVGFGKHSKGSRYRGKNMKTEDVLSDSESESSSDEDEIPPPPQEPVSPTHANEIDVTGKEKANTAFVNPKVVAWVNFIFEKTSSKEKFLKLLQGEGVEITNVKAEGEETIKWDNASGWIRFNCIKLKKPGNVKANRTYAVNIRTRQICIFKTSQLLGGKSRQLLVDASNALESYTVKPEKLSLELVASKHRNRARWAIIHPNAKVPQRDGLHDMLFSSMVERDCFVAALHAMSLPPPKLVLPQSIKLPGHALLMSDTIAPIAKYQRLAWTTPKLEWFSKKKTMFLGTFNTGDAPPPNTNVLHRWVPKPKDDDGFDAYVFGLQECPKFDEWVKSLQAHLGPEAYKLVTVARLWEIGIVVYAKYEEANHMSLVETGTEATGLSIGKEVTGIQLGNKGGVAAGLLWRDTSICFLSSHLAAHQEAIKERNRDAAQIFGRLPLTNHAGNGYGLEITHGFEHCFVLGDLNYRINLTFKKAVALANADEFDKLNELDQLQHEIKKGSAYYNFECPPCKFIPTYRWKRGKHEFSNKKDQPPSYTDRILWHSRPGLENGVKLLKYDCAKTLQISDHRPVVARVRIKVREKYMPWPYHPLVVDYPTEAADSVAATSKMTLSQMKAKKKKKVKHSALPSEAFSMTQGGNHTVSKVPKLWLGALGSFFHTLEESAMSFAPKIELNNVILTLSANEETNAPVPPTFTRLRFISRILHTTESTGLAPGTLEHPNELKAGKQPEYANQTQKAFKELYYEWSNAENTKLPKLLPTIFDPTYLLTQHILVAVESKSAKLHISTSVDGADSFNTNEDSPASATGKLDRKSSFGAFAAKITGKRKKKKPSVIQSKPIQETNEYKHDSLNGGLLTKKRREQEINEAEKQHLEHSLNLKGLPSRAGSVLIGQCAISLRNIVEAVIRAGPSAWAPGADVPILTFSEPVIRAGIRVGTLAGELQLTPGDNSELRRVAVQRSLQKASDIDDVLVIKSGKMGVSLAKNDNLVTEEDQNTLNADMGLPPRGPESTPTVKKKKGGSKTNVLQVNTTPENLIYNKCFAFLAGDGLLYLMSRQAPAPGRVRKPTRGILQMIDIGSGGVEYQADDGIIEISGDIIFDINLKKKMANAALENPRVIVRMKDDEADDAKAWVDAIKELQAGRAPEEQVVIPPPAAEGAEDMYVPPPPPAESGEEASGGEPNNLINNLVGMLQTGLEGETKEEGEMYIPPPPPPPE